MVGIARPGSIAPDPAARRLRFALGALQLVESHQRPPRRDTSYAFADEACVDEHAVFGQEVGRCRHAWRPATLLRATRRNTRFPLETHPPVQNERGEALSPTATLGRQGGVVFSRSDSEQADATDAGHVDRITAGDTTDEDRVGPNEANAICG